MTDDDSLHVSVSEDDFDWSDRDSEDEDWPAEAWLTSDHQTDHQEHSRSESGLFYPSLPLDSSKDEFRLLQVHAVDPNEPLRCTLVIHSLKDSPQYEALSYTWGASTLGRTVKVNTTNLAITDNLYDALRRLASTQTTRTLWVDALCINQADKAERAQQVAAMSAIYKLAHKVVIWLGEANEPTVDPQSRFTERLPTSRDGDNEFYERWKQEDHVLRSFLAATETTKPSWWKRIWTLQEAVLATRDPVIRFGPYTMTWEMLSPLLHSLNGQYQELQPKEFIKHLKNIRFLKNQVSTGSCSLSSASLRAGITKATEPRDHVYGLLGLISSSEVTCIQPNYNDSLMNVYARATFAAMQCSARTDSLLRIVFISESDQISGKGQENDSDSLGAPNLRSLGYFSWILDWGRDFSRYAPIQDNIDSNYIPDRALLDGEYMPSRNANNPRFALNGLRLTMMGYWVDKICVKQHPEHDAERSKSYGLVSLLATMLRSQLRADLQHAGLHSRKTNMLSLFIPDPPTLENVQPGDMAEQRDTFLSCIEKSVARLASPIDELPDDGREEARYEGDVPHRQAMTLAHGMIAKGTTELTEVDEESLDRISVVNQTDQEASQSYLLAVLQKVRHLGSGSDADTDEKAIFEAVTTDPAAVETMIADWKRDQDAVMTDLYFWEQYADCVRSASSLFCTASGVVGLALDVVKKDDVLVAVPGFSYFQVMVLRPKKAGYHFMGFALVTRLEMKQFRALADFPVLEETAFTLC